MAGVEGRPQPPVLETGALPVSYTPKLFGAGEGINPRSQQSWSFTTKLPAKFSRPTITKKLSNLYGFNTLNCKMHTLQYFAVFMKILEL